MFSPINNRYVLIKKNKNNNLVNFFLSDQTSFDVTVDIYTLTIYYEKC